MTHVSTDDRLDAVLHTLADRVRRLRQERDLTVTALSFEAGISESRVRAIESGRTTASLATLVALAETFEIELSELFGDAPRDSAEREPASPYVVPSEVVWGGELPPAPWMSPAAAAPAPSPHVVPSEVVWGGELPAAAWTTAKPAPDMPEPSAAAAPRVSSAVPDVVPYTPTEKVWGGPLPPAPWTVEGHGAAPAVAAPTSPAPSSIDRVQPSSAASHVHQRAAAHGMEGASRYVLIAPSAATPREPRTFSDLREGVLAGREFRSLREFAVAAVTEAEHTLVAVARIFRVPVWKLEQWVAEAGYIGR